MRPDDTLVHFAIAGMEQNRGSPHAEGLRCDSLSHNSSDDGGADNSWYRRRALIQPAATDFRLRVWRVLRNCLPLGALPGHGPSWLLLEGCSPMQVGHSRFHASS